MTFEDTVFVLLGIAVTLVVLAMMVYALLIAHSEEKPKSVGRITQPARSRDLSV